MSAEINASVEKYVASDNNSLLKVEVTQGNTDWVEYFSDKKEALDSYLESRTTTKIYTLMCAGMSIGSIIAGVVILLKDHDIGPVQASAGMGGIIIGATMRGLIYPEAINKLRLTNAGISAIENYQD